MPLMGLAVRRHGQIFLLKAFLCLWTPWVAWSAMAQPLDLWVWKDGQGRLVYSDRQPPSNIPQSHIIQQPANVASAAGNTAPRALTNVAMNDLSPREVVRRDNCLAAQASITELRGRKNWLVEDEHGTRRPMDEGLRRAETARLRQIMRDNCTYAR